MTGDQERQQEAEREERWVLAGRRGREPSAGVPHELAPEVQTGLDSPSSLATAPNPALPSGPGGGMESEERHRAGLQAYLNLGLRQEAVSLFGLQSPAS